MTTRPEKAKRARIMEERRALRYAIALLGDVDLEGNRARIEALERLARKLYSAAPDYPVVVYKEPPKRPEPKPPVAAMAQQPRDPIAQYVSHVFRMGRKVTKQG